MAHGGQEIALGVGRLARFGQRHDQLTLVIDLSADVMDDAEQARYRTVGNAFLGLDGDIQDPLGPVAARDPHLAIAARPTGISGDQRAAHRHPVGRHD